MASKADQDEFSHLPWVLRCEARAVASGHKAFVNKDGSIKVVSDTTPGVSYRVTYFGDARNMVWFQCTCKGGEKRDMLTVPCWHSALAARRLDREKLITFAKGAWWVRGAEPK